ncbi:STAS domain-containing protein [Streptomyces griseofuscus]|uniref:STAS domain-containing protein n=1 Tax=Streptomyces griseofuscus TaxID=146922 RepID=UPI00380D64C3
MDITIVIDGNSARISPYGEIDSATLPPLRAAVNALPPQVTDLQWDLSPTPFMDIAGLHLLFTPAPSSGPERRMTVTGTARTAAVAATPAAPAGGWWRAAGGSGPCRPYARGVRS